MPSAVAPIGLGSLVHDPLFAVVVIGVVCLPGLCITLWVIACGHRSRFDRELAGLRQALETSQAGCAQSVTGLSRNLAALEAGRQSADELLRGGRLSQSCRAQALQLLRSGMAPDTAAVTLGVAVREMRLLAKVSRVLISPAP